MAWLKVVLNKISVGCVCLGKTGLKNKSKFSKFLDYCISMKMSNENVQMSTVSPEGGTVIQHVSNMLGPHPWLLFPRT